MKELFEVFENCEKVTEKLVEEQGGDREGFVFSEGGYLCRFESSRGRRVISLKKAKGFIVERFKFPDGGYTITFPGFDGAMKIGVSEETMNEIILFCEEENGFFSFPVTHSNMLVLLTVEPMDVSLDANNRLWIKFDTGEDLQYYLD